MKKFKNILDEEINNKSICDVSKIFDCYTNARLKTEINKSFHSLIDSQEIRNILKDNLNEKYNTDVFTSMIFELEIPYTKYISSKRSNFIPIIHTENKNRLLLDIKIPYEIEKRNKEFFINILEENIEDKIVDTIQNYNEKYEKLKKDLKDKKQEVINTSEKEIINKVKNPDTDFEKISLFYTLNELKALSLDLTKLSIKIKRMKESMDDIKLINKSLKI